MKRLGPVIRLRFSTGFLPTQRVVKMVLEGVLLVWLADQHAVSLHGAQQRSGGLKREGTEQAADSCLGVLCIDSKVGYFDFKSCSSGQGQKSANSPLL